MQADPSLSRLLSGIKYNMKNGEPALESFTDAVYEATRTIERVRVLAEAPRVDLDRTGKTVVGDMVVEVIDPVEDYVEVRSTGAVLSGVRSKHGGS